MWWGGGHLSLCHGSPIVFPTHKPLWEMRIAWVDGSFHMTLWSQVSLALLFSCSLLHKNCFYWCLWSYSIIIHFCIYINIYMFTRCYCPRQLTNEECGHISNSFYGELLQNCFEKHKSVFYLESGNVYIYLWSILKVFLKLNFQLACYGKCLWCMWAEPEYFVYEKLQITVTW